MVFPPLRGTHLYAPRREVLLHGSVSADMPIGLSRSPIGVETLYFGIFTTRSLQLYCRDFSLSEPPSIPLMGFLSLGQASLWVFLI